MCKIIYNFLSESIFFNDDSIGSDFSNESEERLQDELSKYRNYCIENIEEIAKEITDNSSILRVFSSTNKTSLDLLKQTALYINQFIIADPIFPFTEPKKEITDHASKAFGYRVSQFDKVALANSCKFLRTITSMVAGDYVKIFPISYYHERSTIPFHIPQNLANDILPSPILDFFKENAVVSSLKKMDDEEGWAMQDGIKFLSRGIDVNFKNSDQTLRSGYHLTQIKVLETNEETREVTFAQFIPPTPPSQEEFDAWVTQSINQSAKKYFDAVLFDNVVAAQLKASYLSNNTFSSELISRNFETTNTISTFTANQILNLELPFLPKIKTDKLMEIRIKEADIFTNFRIELEKHCRELRTITDPKELKISLENVLHELNEVQGQKIKTGIALANKKMKINSSLAIGGLASSYLAGGFSLLAVALDMGNGYKDWKEYRANVIDNPSYFLWKIQQ